MDVKLELLAIKQLEEVYLQAVNDKLGAEVTTDLHNRLSMLRKIVIDKILVENNIQEAA